MNFELGTKVFVSRVRKLNFNELAWRIRILRVKFSEDYYYLELNIEDRVLKKGKKTTYIYKEIMFIHIEYLLQDTSILQ